MKCYNVQKSWKNKMNSLLMSKKYLSSHTHSKTSYTYWILFIIEDSINKKFYEAGFDFSIIPGGLTSICQLFDVAINKPFKDNLRKEWHLIKISFPSVD